MRQHLEINMNERGMYFNFKELPFPLVRNNYELERCIKDINFFDIIEKYSEFEKRIGLNESGEASKIIGDKIIKILKGENDEQK